MFTFSPRDGDGRCHQKAHCPESQSSQRERERDGAKALSQSPQREREKEREREREKDATKAFLVTQCLYPLAGLRLAQPMNDCKV